MNIIKRILFIGIGGIGCASLILLSCSKINATHDRPLKPQMILPNPPSYGSFDRNYGLSESPDGKLRVFTAERGDDVNLMVMRKTPNGWTDPKPLNLPKLKTIATGHFSPWDGRFYYSTDIPAPGLDAPRNIDIWSVKLNSAGEIESEPEFFSHDINRVSHERSAVFTAKGTLYFTSTHKNGAGGLDIYEATQDADGKWHSKAMDGNTIMGESDLALSPDGKYMFFYAHVPQVFGKVDIFYRKRTANGWTPRKNMGPFINSAGIDYGPGFSASGKTFFFSRDGQMFEVDFQTAMRQAKKYNDGLKLNN